MSSPTSDFTEFFKKMSQINGVSSFSTFAQQYWYAWLIVAIIVVGVIVLNVSLIAILRKKKNDKKSDRERLPRNGDETGEPGEQLPFKKTFYMPQIMNMNNRSDETSTNALVDQSHFSMDALIAHNVLRAKHNVPDLKYNQSLAKIAKIWAETLAKTNQLQHSPENWRVMYGKTLGENLAYNFGKSLTGKEMSHRWYAEIKDYDFDVHDETIAKQLTQMIWKNTKEVGFGVAKSLKGNWYYGVALYYPCGNIVGQYYDNVFPASDEL